MFKKKPYTEVIRISPYNPKLANNKKQERLFDLSGITEVVKKLANDLIYQDKVKSFLNKTDTSNNTLYPARLYQVITKAASAIARSVKNKVDKANRTTNKKQYQLEILQKYNTKTLEIDITNVNLELDQRFIDIQSVKNTSINIDYWVKITSFPYKSFYIPLKLTRHMKYLIRRGFELDIKSLRISSNGTIGLYFKKILKYKDDIQTPINTIGIDLGRNKMIVSNTGQMESTHSTSKSIKEILELVMRRKQGSRSFNKTLKYLHNQVNFSINNINWNKISYLSIENLSNIKRYKKWGKKNQFWPIGYIGEKLNQLSQEYGVRIIEIMSAYTSQECNVCGFIHKNNRNAEKFKCMNCSYEIDADYNASVNIYNRGINSSSAEWSSISCCNMNLKKL